MEPCLQVDHVRVRPEHGCSHRSDARQRTSRTERASDEQPPQKTERRVLASRALRRSRKIDLVRA